MADDNLFGIVQQDGIQLIEIENDDPFGPETPIEPITKVKEKTEEEDKDKKKKVETTPPPADDSIIEVEAEKKVEESKPVVAPKDEGGEGAEDVNTFGVYAEELYKLGIFKAGVDEEGNEVTYSPSTPEEFQEMWIEQHKAYGTEIIENALSSRGDEVRAIFEAMYYDGVDPREYLPVAKSLQDFSSLDLQKEGNSELVVREALKRQGYKEDVINKKVDRLKSLSELENEAEEVLPVLIEGDRQNLARQEQEAKQKEQNALQSRANYKSSIIRVLQEKIKQKDFDGIPLDGTAGNKALDFLYEQKWELKNGRKLTDFDKFIMELDKPENHALKVKVGLLAMNNFDLSRIQKKAVSNETNSLFSKLKGKEIKQQVKTKPEDNNWD